MLISFFHFFSLYHHHFFTSSTMAFQTVQHFLWLAKAPRIPYTHPDDPYTLIVRHDTYYLPRGDLFLLINNILFHLHKYFLIHESQPWHEYLMNTSRGRSAYDPININWDIPFSFSITPLHFALFLWVFYNPTYSLYDAPELMWLDIQALASIWDMPHVEDLARRQLEWFNELDDLFAEHLALRDHQWSQQNQMDSDNDWYRVSVLVGGYCYDSYFLISFLSFFLHHWTIMCTITPWVSLISFLDRKSVV